MIDYRNLIKSRDLRIKILKALDFVPDRLLVRLQFLLQTGKLLHLKTPKTFNEKLQVYKLTYRNPEMLRCTDKVSVREFVSEKGLEEILVPVYGIYDHPEEVDLRKLPDQFVAKISDGGGGHEVFICKDKKDIHEEEFHQLINSWFTTIKPKKHIAREWAYENGIARRLLIERLLTESEDSATDITDYKFFCFNGKFRCLQVHKDRTTNHKQGFYDENLNYYKGVSILYPCFEDAVDLPDNIREMIEISEKLSQDFPFVRVDLYNINGKIYFSELTFYPASGYLPFKPDSFDHLLGSLFNLPEKSKVH